MLILIKEKFNSILTKNRTNYESIKISLIYLIFGFTWVYFSDRIANLLFRNRKILLIVNTYKGFMYIFLTSCILYLLINNLLKKIYLKEEQLKNSYTELEAYVQQLAASEEALRVQYDQIYENEQQISKSEEKAGRLLKQYQMCYL
ncbi:hypothetical protein B0H42_003864 [Clostridium saccharobutylicum]|nr:hypothetical protein [Clostridium saccharobutylicum]